MKALITWTLLLWVFYQTESDRKPHIRGRMHSQSRIIRTSLIYLGVILFICRQSFIYWSSQSFDLFRPFTGQSTCFKIISKLQITLNNFVETFALATDLGQSEWILKPRMNEFWNLFSDLWIAAIFTHTYLPTRRLFTSPKINLGCTSPKIIWLNWKSNQHC